MLDEELNREDFGIDVQVRPAVGKAERERGVQVFRTASMAVLEGARLQKFVEGKRLNYQMISRGALELGDLIRTLAMWGCAARLQGLGIISPVASGQCEADDPDPAAHVKISYHLRLEKGLQERVQTEAKFRIRKMPSAAPKLVQLQRMAGKGEFAGEVEPGEILTVRGRALTFDQQNPDEGVFFADVQRPMSERIRVEGVIIAYASLTFVIPPQLQQGHTYELIVRAKLRRCSDVREGIFPSDITITA